MRTIIASFLLLLAASAAEAQNTISDVLQSVAQNNRSLQANAQLTKALREGAYVGNYLQNPSVQYDYLFGSPSSLGKSGELTVSQAFDFPTVYSNKNKLSKLKEQEYNAQATEFRQTILLQAKQVCIDLIFLKQQQQMLKERQENARQLAELYETRFKNGDANILEKNKIELEFLNIKTEASLNKVAYDNKMEELRNLNGGAAIDFNLTQYPDSFALPSKEEVLLEATGANTSLIALKHAGDVARKQVSVNKALALPKFELGFRRDFGKGEQFNGFTVGVSIPLFENKNTVKSAKSQAIYTDMQLQAVQSDVQSQLLQNLQQVETLKQSMDEYAKALSLQNNETLLNKAFRAGNISLIEYFIELSTLYQSRQNYLQLQNQYQKAMADIYKYKL